MVDKALDHPTKTKRTSNGSCTKQTTEQSKWSELPTDLLELIFIKLLYIDATRFRAVCPLWKNAVNFNSIPRNPWLMLPSSQENNVNSRRFFNPEDRSFYTMKNIFRTFRHPCCVGSSHGWLVLLDRKAVAHIFNPLTRVSIQLPEIGTLVGLPNSFDVEVNAVHKRYRDLNCKAVLSSDPSHNQNFVAAVIFKQQKSKLAFCKQGYKSWIELSNDQRKHLWQYYSDVIFHNDDQLSAILHEGSHGLSVDIWYLNQTPSLMKTIMLQPQLMVGREYHGNFRRTYLVESLGELLFVVRTIGNSYENKNFRYRTKDFYIFKMNRWNSQLEKVECLHDRALFLGGNQSMSLSTRSFTEIKDNSIYFTDDHWSGMNLNYYYYHGTEEDGYIHYGGHDLGVYNLEDRAVKPFDQIDQEHIINPPPFWILPNPAVR
ncbi:hypothetical protein M0R45_018573 [Rubus argutus]|uniref:F-box domain-containing protein n=1 Tax=Rubus argutus TaxID=59490 RepID=A0AAW1X4B2_RUBAR